MGNNMRKMYTEQKVQELAQSKVKEMLDNGELAIKNKKFTFDYELATPGLVEIPTAINNELKKYNLIYLVVETPKNSDEYTIGLYYFFDKEQNSYKNKQLLYASTVDGEFVSISLGDGEMYFQTYTGSVGDEWEITIVPII